MNSIKNNLLSLTLLLCSSFAFSQFQFGVKAGGGISNTTVVHGTSKERFGFVGGAVAKYQLTSNSEAHYLQAELLYTNQGEYSIDKFNNKYKAFIDYINLPIMYKFYFDDQGSDFFLEAGPQFGYVIADNIDPAEPEYANNELKKFDLAFNVGVGYSYMRKYEINLRYGIGLIDTFDYNIFDNDTNRTSLLSLGLTYYF